jgi:hypothetical protein
MGFGQSLVVSKLSSCLEARKESRQSFTKEILFVWRQRCMIVCGSTLLDTLLEVAYHGTREELW